MRLPFDRVKQIVEENERFEAILQYSSSASFFQDNLNLVSKFDQEVKEHYDNNPNVQAAMLAFLYMLLNGEEGAKHHTPPKEYIDTDEEGEYEEEEEEEKEEETMTNQQIQHQQHSTLCQSCSIPAVSPARRSTERKFPNSLTGGGPRRDPFADTSSDEEEPSFAEEDEEDEEEFDFDDEDDDQQHTTENEDGDIVANGGYGKAPAQWGFFNDEDEENNNNNNPSEEYNNSNVSEEYNNSNVKDDDDDDVPPLLPAFTNNGNQGNDDPLNNSGTSDATSLTLGTQHGSASPSISQVPRKKSSTQHHFEEYFSDEEVVADSRRGNTGGNKVEDVPFFDGETISMTATAKKNLAKLRKKKQELLKSKKSKENKEDAAAADGEKGCNDEVENEEKGNDESTSTTRQRGEDDETEEIEGAIVEIFGANIINDPRIAAHNNLNAPSSHSPLHGRFVKLNAAHGELPQEKKANQEIEAAEEAKKQKENNARNKNTRQDSSSNNNNNNNDNPQNNNPQNGLLTQLVEFMANTSQKATFHSEQAGFHTAESIKSNNMAVAAALFVKGKLEEARKDPGAQLSGIFDGMICCQEGCDMTCLFRMRADLLDFPGGGLSVPQIFMNASKPRIAKFLVAHGILNVDIHKDSHENIKEANDFTIKTNLHCSSCAEKGTAKWCTNAGCQLAQEKLIHFNKTHVNCPNCQYVLQSTGGYHKDFKMMFRGAKPVLQCKAHRINPGWYGPYLSNASIASRAQQKWLPCTEDEYNKLPDEDRQKTRNKNHPNHPSRNTASPAAVNTTVNLSGNMLSANIPPGSANQLPTSNAPEFTFQKKNGADARLLARGAKEIFRVLLALCYREKKSSSAFLEGLNSSAGSNDDWISRTQKAVLDLVAAHHHDPERLASLQFKVASMDESKFSKRKHNKGNLVRIVCEWVFVVTEVRPDGTCGEMYTALVPNRTRETLAAEVNKVVKKKGAEIYTDSFTPYVGKKETDNHTGFLRHLEEVHNFEDLSHYVINHSKAFVAHKQQPDGSWKLVTTNHSESSNSVLKYIVKSTFTHIAGLHQINLRERVAFAALVTKTKSPAERLVKLTAAIKSQLGKPLLPPCSLPLTLVEVGKKIYRKDIDFLDFIPKHLRPKGVGGDQVVPWVTSPNDDNKSWLFTLPKASNSTEFQTSINELVVDADRHFIAFMDTENRPDCRQKVHHCTTKANQEHANSVKLASITYAVAEEGNYFCSFITIVAKTYVAAAEGMVTTGIVLPQNKQRTRLTTAELDRVTGIDDDMMSNAGEALSTDIADDVVNPGEIIKFRHRRCFQVEDGTILNVKNPNGKFRPMIRIPLDADAAVPASKKKKTTTTTTTTNNNNNNNSTTDNIESSSASLLLQNTNTNNNAAASSSLLLQEDSAINNSKPKSTRGRKNAQQQTAVDDVDEFLANLRSDDGKTPKELHELWKRSFEEAIAKKNERALRFFRQQEQSQNFLIPSSQKNKFTEAFFQEQFDLGDVRYIAPHCYDQYLPQLFHGFGRGAMFPFFDALFTPATPQDPSFIECVMMSPDIGGIDLMQSFNFSKSQSSDNENQQETRQQILLAEAQQEASKEMFNFLLFCQDTLCDQMKNVVSGETARTIAAIGSRTSVFDNMNRLPFNKFCYIPNLHSSTCYFAVSCSSLISILELRQLLRQTHHGKTAFQILEQVPNLLRIPDSLHLFAEFALMKSVVSKTKQEIIKFGDDERTVNNIATKIYGCMLNNSGLTKDFKINEAASATECVDQLLSQVLDEYEDLGDAPYLPRASDNEEQAKDRAKELAIYNSIKENAPFNRFPLAAHRLLSRSDKVITYSLEPNNHTMSIVIEDNSEEVYQCKQTAFLLSSTTVSMESAILHQISRRYVINSNDNLQVQTSICDTLPPNLFIIIGDRGAQLTGETDPSPAVQEVRHRCQAALPLHLKEGTFKLYHQMDHIPELMCFAKNEEQLLLYHIEFIAVQTTCCSPDGQGRLYFHPTSDIVLNGPGYITEEILLNNLPRPPRLYDQNLPHKSKRMLEVSEKMIEWCTEFINYFAAVSGHYDYERPKSGNHYVCYVWLEAFGDDEIKDEDLPAVVRNKRHEYFLELDDIRSHNGCRANIVHRDQVIKLASTLAEIIRYKQVPLTPRFRHVPEHVAKYHADKRREEKQTQQQQQQEQEQSDEEDENDEQQQDAAAASEAKKKKKAAPTAKKAAATAKKAAKKVALRQEQPDLEVLEYAKPRFFVGVPAKTNKGDKVVNVDGVLKYAKLDLSAELNCVDRNAPTASVNEEQVRQVVFNHLLADDDIQDQIKNDNWRIYDPYRLLKSFIGQGQGRPDDFSKTPWVVDFMEREKRRLDREQSHDRYDGDSIEFRHMELGDERRREARRRLLAERLGRVYNGNNNLVFNNNNNPTSNAPAPAPAAASTNKMMKTTEDAAPSSKKITKGGNNNNQNNSKNKTKNTTTTTRKKK